MSVERGRPGRAFRLAITHHSRAFLFAVGVPPDRRTCGIVPDRHGRGDVVFIAAILAEGLSSVRRSIPSQGASEATRNPILLFSLFGLLLFRLEDARLLSLLLYDPPRRPRLEPSP